MSLREGLDKLFGAGKYAEARKKVDGLEEKKKLTGRDKKDRRVAEEILQDRRTFLKRALVTTVGLTAGAALGVSNKEKLGCENPDKSKNKTSGDEEKNLDSEFTSYSQNTSENIRRHEGIPSSEEMRKTMDRGFDLVMKDIPNDPRDGINPQEKILGSMKLFRKKAVKWAKMKGRKLIALENGIKEGGWIVILDPDSEMFRRQTNVFQISSSSQPSLSLNIKPCPITDIWAGIALTHEMVHLHDMVMKIEPRRANKKQYLDGESRAYIVEKMLVDHLSKGAYTKALQQFVKSYDIQTLEDLGRYTRSHRALAFKEIDQAITREAPKSTSERNVRMGFHHMMIAFEIEINRAKGAGQKPDFSTMVEVIMNRGRSGHHIPKR